MSHARSRSVLLALLFSLVAAQASAQPLKGTITGTVKDKDTGQPIAGVTVVAQGPQGELAEVTDDKGNYTITEVPVGKYLVVFFTPGGNAPKMKREAWVEAGSMIRVNATFSQKEEDSKKTEKVIEIVEKASALDIGSTKRGTKFDRDYMNRAPSSGRSSGGFLPWRASRAPDERKAERARAAPPPPPHRSMAPPPRPLTLPLPPPPPATMPAPQAGSADDNLQFNAFLRFLAEHGKYALPADVSTRVVVTVRDRDGRPLPDAAIRVVDGQRTLLLRHTYADGRALVQASELRPLAQYPLDVQVGDATVRLQPGWHRKPALEVRLPVHRGETREVPLDVAFVLDTTGSMGGQIQSLRETLAEISTQLAHLHPRPDVRFGMVLYRDRGDEYVTRVVPFTPSLPDFQRALDGVVAGGGGDTPEDVQAGLEQAVRALKWRGHGVRIAFLVGDAAPHLDYEERYTYVDAMHEAAARGIKIATVGVDGLDLAGEVAWRQIAQYTMAPFVFLTFGEKGDSEGGTPSSVSHHIGSNWVAENLDAIIVRLVKTELAHYSKTGSPPREDFFEASRGKGPSDDVLSDLFRQSVQQLTDYCVHRLDDRTPTVVAGLAAPDAALGKLAGKLETQLQLGLSRARAFQLVEGAETNKLRQVLKTQSSLSYDETRMIALGKLVPAKLAVLSQLSRGAPGRLELVVKLVHLGSGEILSMSLLKIDESLLASR